MVNLPTTGTFRGSMARALDDLGSGPNREIAMLALATDRGLRIGGVATVAEIHDKMVELGCEFVVDLKDGAANQDIPLTYHDCDEYWILLEGAGESVVGDTHYSMRPGVGLVDGAGAVV